MLSVIMVSVIMLNVIMLSIIMLNVVALINPEISKSGYNREVILDWNFRKKKGRTEP